MTRIFEHPEGHRLRMEALEAKLAFQQLASVWQKKSHMNWPSYPWHLQRDRDRAAEWIKDDLCGAERQSFEKLLMDVCSAFDAWKRAQAAFEEAEKKHAAP